MKNAKVSVMVPTYNQAGMIIRAIRSALAQDHKNIEVIVSDDCSTDDTKSVVEKFIEDCGDGRVSYFRNEDNIGILRNYHRTLFDRTTGDWVVNLDADDFFVDNSFISKAMAITEDDPDVALVFADYCEYNEATGVRIPIRNQDHPAVMTDIDFLDRYADDRIVWNHNSIIYNRALATRIGCYWEEGVLRNDWESFLRMTIGRKVARMDRVVAAWVQHGANETRRLDLNKYLNNFALIDGVAAYAIGQGLAPDFVGEWQRRMTVKSAKSSAVAYLRARDYRGLARFLQRVHRRAPGLPMRVLTDPGFIARGALASNARLYGAVKRLMRRRVIAS